MSSTRISWIAESLPGSVPPNGVTSVGEKNEEMNATTAYGVHAATKVTKETVRLSSVSVDHGWLRRDRYSYSAPISNDFLARPQSEGV